MVSSGGPERTWYTTRLRAMQFFTTVWKLVQIDARNAAPSSRTVGLDKSGNEVAPTADADGWLARTPKPTVAVPTAIAVGTEKMRLL